MVMDFQIGTQIPSDYITKRIAILAKVDAGKTYTAGVIQEEFAKNNMPFVVVDPMGAHWGIREKFSVLIMGGMHGDLELQPGDGRYIARMIVAQNVSIILDVSEFTQDEQCEFAADFGDELFLLHKKSSSPRHIFWEEADIFAPQRTKAVSLPVLDTLVRRGRQFGIGSTVITQRPAVLNKNILTQMDCYFFLNIVGQQDLKTVKELLQTAHLNKDEIKDYIEQMIQFQKGQALIFSPGWLNTIKIYQGRLKESYHAGQTPVYGVTMQIPPLLKYNCDTIKQILNEAVTGEKETSINISGTTTIIVGIIVSAILIGVFGI